MGWFGSILTLQALRARSHSIAAESTALSAEISATLANIDRQRDRFRRSVFTANAENLLELIRRCCTQANIYCIGLPIDNGQLGNFIVTQLG